MAKLNKTKVEKALAVLKENKDSINFINSIFSYNILSKEKYQQKDDDKFDIIGYWSTLETPETLAPFFDEDDVFNYVEYSYSFFNEGESYIVEWAFMFGGGYSDCIDSAIARVEFVLEHNTDPSGWKYEDSLKTILNYQTLDSRLNDTYNIPRLKEALKTIVDNKDIFNMQMSLFSSKEIFVNETDIYLINAQEHHTSTDPECNTACCAIGFLASFEPYEVLTQFTSRNDKNEFKEICYSKYSDWKIMSTGHNEYQNQTGWGFLLSTLHDDNIEHLILRMKFAVKHNRCPVAWEYGDDLATILLYT